MKKKANRKKSRAKHRRKKQRKLENGRTQDVCEVNS